MDQFVKSFINRVDIKRLLSSALDFLKSQDATVLAITRGSIVVGYVIA